MAASEVGTTVESGRMAKRERSAYLEGILELGRNWALAIAICSAGLVASRTETVNGPNHWEDLVFTACILLSLIWMALAVLRFDEVLVSELRTRYARLISRALIAILIFLGIGLVLGLAKFYEQDAIVRICDSVPDSTSSRIHSYDECVRLKAQRDALRERLESP